MVEILWIYFSYGIFQNIDFLKSKLDREKISIFSFVKSLISSFDDCVHKHILYVQKKKKKNNFATPF